MPRHADAHPEKFFLESVRNRYETRFDRASFVLGARDVLKVFKELCDL